MTYLSNRGSKKDTSSTFRFSDILQFVFIQMQFILKILLVIKVKIQHYSFHFLISIEIFSFIKILQIIFNCMNDTFKV